MSTLSPEQADQLKANSLFPEQLPIGEWPPIVHTIVDGKYITPLYVFGWRVRISDIMKATGCHNQRTALDLFPGLLLKKGKQYVANPKIIQNYLPEADSACIGFPDHRIVEFLSNTEEYMTELKSNTDLREDVIKVARSIINFDEVLNTEPTWFKFSYSA